MKLVGRDAAHSSTRLLERPFAKHPAINSVMEEIVYGSDSVCQKIHHSPLFTKWWKEAIGKGDEGNDPGHEEAHVSSSMSSAKHRFASYFLPLSRVCKNVKAMLQLLHRVCALRGTAGHWAGKTLANLTGEKIALLDGSRCGSIIH